MNTRDQLAASFQTHRKALAGYLTRLVVREDIADELVQQAAVRALEQESLPADAGELRAWFFRVATHLALDYLRKHSTWREGLLGETKGLAETDAGFVAESRLLAGKPRAKVFPAIGDGLAVWSEPPMSAADPNPSDYGDYYGISTALATLDLATGKRCQLQGDTPGLLSFKSVHGRHVYGGWFDSKSVKTWLVDVDLDHPSLQWSCVMTPGWGQ